MPIDSSGSVSAGDRGSPAPSPARRAKIDNGLEAIDGSGYRRWRQDEMPRVRFPMRNIRHVLSHRLRESNTPTQAPTHRPEYITLLLTHDPRRTHEACSKILSRTRDYAYPGSRSSTSSLFFYLRICSCCCGFWTDAESLQSIQTRGDLSQGAACLPAWHATCAFCDIGTVPRPLTVHTRVALCFCISARRGRGNPRLRMKCT